MSSSPANTDKLKRPLNAFFTYRVERAAEMKVLNASLPTPIRFTRQMAADEWNAMSTEQQEYYYAEAERKRRLQALLHPGHIYYHPKTSKTAKTLKVARNSKKPPRSVRGVAAGPSTPPQAVVVNQAPVGVEIAQPQPRRSLALPIAQFLWDAAHSLPPSEVLADEAVAASTSSTNSFVMPEDAYQTYEREPAMYLPYPDVLFNPALDNNGPYPFPSIYHECTPHCFGGGYMDMRMN